jgi:hypothetical protein
LYTPEDGSILLLIVVTVEGIGGITAVGGVGEMVVLILGIVGWGEGSVGIIIGGGIVKVIGGGVIIGGGKVKVGCEIEVSVVVTDGWIMVTIDEYIGEMEVVGGLNELVVQLSLAGVDIVTDV